MTAARGGHASAPVTSAPRSAKARTPPHRSRATRTCSLARRDGENSLENLSPLLLDRDAVEHVAAIDVHVLDHPPVHFAVGRQLYRGRRLAAVGGTARVREAEHVGATRHLSGDGDGVVALEAPLAKNNGSALC
jgi:hypothetical protein